MEGMIHSVDLRPAFAAQMYPSSQIVFPNEISGLTTRAISIPPGQRWRAEPDSSLGCTYLLVDGKGEIRCGSQSWPVSEISFFIPALGCGAEFSAGAGLSILEIAIEMSQADSVELADRAAHFPWFVSYATCRTYRERIKSPKTVNRTLLPEYTFPRLCVGSVQTTGPDRVAPHKHPMLEQLFFGLKGNDCVVTADGTRIPFGEYELLHIPLGSEHGVEVAEGRDLHYVWIDFFWDRAGMEWIRREHIEDK